MEVGASHRLSRLINDLLYKGFCAGGNIGPKLKAGIPYDIVTSLCQHIGVRGKSTEDIEFSLKQTAVGKYMYMVHTTVVWTSWLEPSQSEYVSEVIPRLQLTLVEMGGQQLDAEQTADLCRAMASLVEVPRDPDTIGSIGLSLLRSAQEELRSLPAARDRTRARAQFSQQAKVLCQQIENTRNPADRKVVAAKLAEILGRELKKSKHRHPDYGVKIFWTAYEMFAPPSFR